MRIFRTHDRIYGNAEIREPLLLELIRSTPVQRLKKISQSGMWFITRRGVATTRFEHSIGVTVLLKRLGAPAEEQAAGLLHDLGHTAFSHVADVLMHNRDHTFHESFQKTLIDASEIPAILERHGLSPKTILQLERFPLLEKKLPELCADRLDYSIRDMAQTGVSRNRIRHYVREINVVGNTIAFRQKNTAEQFALDFIRTDQTYWSSARQLLNMRLLADALRTGLDERALQLDDLFTDDPAVLKKLRAAKNREIDRTLKLIQRPPAIFNAPNKPEFRLIGKIRFVEPAYLRADNTLGRVGKKGPLKNKIRKYVARAQQGHLIRLAKT